MTNRVSFFRKDDLVEANKEGIDLGFPNTVEQDLLESLSPEFKYVALYGWATRDDVYSCQVLIGPYTTIILDVTFERYISLPCEVVENVPGLQENIET